MQPNISTEVFLGLNKYRVVFGFSRLYKFGRTSHCRVEVYAVFTVLLTTFYIQPNETRRVEIRQNEIRRDEGKP